MLLSPSANHVYRDATPRLAAAELEITAGFADQIGITSLGRADALRFSADDLDELALAAQSSLLVGFEESDGWLRPLDLPNLQVMDDDLVTIPKYPGKTNENGKIVTKELTAEEREINKDVETFYKKLTGQDFPTYQRKLRAPASVPYLVTSMKVALRRLACRYSRHWPSGCDGRKSPAM